MVPLESDTVSSDFDLHGRIALALTHGSTDLQTQQQVIPFGFVIEDEKIDYVEKLLQNCAAVWDKFTTHRFPSELANGTAYLDGFRHYLIQDAKYLEYYYRLRMEAIAKSGTFKEIREFAAKLSGSLEYVIEMQGACTSKLGVPKDDVAGEQESQELKDSIGLYKKVVGSGDSIWLDTHIVLLPCILGYYTIANKLLSDPETTRNTSYFPLWIQANAGGSSAKKYKDFINNNINDLPSGQIKENWPRWVENFTKACETEEAFFGLATLNNFPTYNIKSSGDNVVKDGTYKIRTYRAGNLYLVVTGSSVTTKQIESQDNEIWQLTNSAEGFTIQNINQQGFLVVSGGVFKPPHLVQVENTAQRWSINVNPVVIGTNVTHQLLVPGRLQFVLDAGAGVSESAVYVTNNSEITSQLWVLEPTSTT